MNMREKSRLAFLNLPDIKTPAFQSKNRCPALLNFLCSFPRKLRRHNSQNE
uniref:Uncharacterized protein n=1 Tax=Anguilla anguilla TaxID=7936 RepID=A0A0E9XI71_ANGAN